MEGIKIYTLLAVFITCILESSNAFESYQYDVLNMTNIYRKKHGVQNLTLSKELCDMAWYTDNDNDGKYTRITRNFKKSVALDSVVAKIYNDKRYFEKALKSFELVRPSATMVSKSCTQMGVSDRGFRFTVIFNCWVNITKKLGEDLLGYKSDQAISDFEQEVLVNINNKRGYHGLGPIKFSREMSDLAQEWAGIAAEYSYFNNLPVSNAVFPSSMYVEYDDYDGSNAVNSWYAEEHNFDYHRQKFTTKTQDFIYMLTANEFGIGKVKVSGKIYVVAYYDGFDEFPSHDGEPLKVQIIKSSYNPLMTWVMWIAIIVFAKLIIFAIYAYARLKKTKPPYNTFTNAQV